MLSKVLKEIAKSEIFPLVVERIKQRKESLTTMDQNKFPMTGIEAWFKVEIVFALSKTKHAIKKLKNQGPDLLLESGIEIELKGATDFNISGLRKETTKHKTFLLFLQNGSNTGKIRTAQFYDDVELLCHEKFSDGKNEWIIGIMNPV